MNKERIASLLQEPARVAREDLAGLRELKERYPWFSGAHLLLALGEHTGGDVLFEETLLTTAAHVPSREVLWENIHEGSAPPEPRARVIPIGSPVIDPATSTTAPEPDRVVRVGTPSPESSDTTSPEVEGSADRTLQRQIIEAAAASVYSLEDLGDLPRLEPPAPSVDEAPAAPREVETLGPRSFLSWLDAAPASTTPTVPYAGGPQGDAHDWIRRPTRPKAPGAEIPASGADHTRGLIDRFLEQSTPEPKRTEFFSPQQAGKRSIEEKLDIATETLARIHEKQGHWAKAARIYHHLALKHPEKSGYFAALAKKAEDNLNL